MKFTNIYLSCILLIMIIAFYKKEIREKQKEQVILDYYQDAETLFDSLYIYENDSIFNTNVGNRYLESKYKFDSLVINNNQIC